MRITHFKIENYRGLRLAALDGLAVQPLTLLTGKNGTGKSLVLEALTAAWSGNINLPEFVGPYGYSMTIELAVSLEDREYDLVDEWRTARELPRAARQSEHVIEAVATNRESTGMYRRRDSLVETLQNPLFAREHPFASIDLLSARRQVSLTTTTSVDLALLDRTAAAEQRKMMYDQEIRWKTAMQMPDIGAYLTSLDYRDYVATRDGIATENDYAKLQEIFQRASGKRITLPTYDPSSTKSSIKVALPSGQTHPLEDLSNGEREMLGMLYYVSQLSALGGVLLLDEPEKHLHPTLQLAVLKAMMSIASRGQILVVTHSPGLISSSPSEQVVVVRPAWEAPGNQLQRVADSDNQAEILSDLGLARRDSVLRTADALRGLDVGVPWTCVVDRDFLTDTEVANIASDGQVFVWDARMLENVLLVPELVEGILMPALPQPGNIGAILAETVGSLRPAAVEQFIDARLARHQPPDGSDGQASDGASARTQGLDKIQRQVQSQVELWTHRLEVYPRVRSEVTAEISANWDSDWRLYVDGKRVFAELQRRFPVYKSGSSELSVGEVAGFGVRGGPGR